MEALEAKAPTYQLASWGRRILSAVIDLLVISFITTPFTRTALQHVLDSYNARQAIGGHDLRTLALAQLAVQVTYMTAFHGWRGSTIGKMAARTVLVRDDGTKVTVAVAFVRSVTFAVIYFVSQFVFAPIIVDELRPLWSPRRQTWHDVVARTIVVRADPRNLTE